nr:AAA family ATPase [Candidatus Dadabacteria bacterium]NIS94977.1 AAA family ATPase [Nitrosopumilaceae archaeon]
KTAFESIKYFNDSFIKVNEKLLEERVEQGCIKDCHGDLHLEHIIIRPDEIEIFDCIEFNDSFRFIDYVCDIAFLSMDLDYHGSFDLSNYFVKNMLAKMQDENARRLVDFYKSYRAYVRGKVGSIRSEDKNIPVNERKKSRQNAKKYFQLSLRYSLFGSDPVVIVVFGLIASGKSTLAAILSKELGCNVISSDVTRKQLAGVPLTKRVSKGLYKGLYSKQMTIKTYTEMYRQAQDELSNNNIVILDASFSQQKYRDLVVDKSNKWNSNIIFIETKASDRVIRQRLLDREKKKSISDARIDLFKRFKQSFEPAGKNLKDVYFKTITKDYPDTDRNIRLLFRDIINRNLTTC